MRTVPEVHRLWNSGWVFFDTSVSPRVRDDIVEGITRQVFRQVYRYVREEVLYDALREIARRRHEGRV
jgi:hypothetical protein